MTTESVPMSEPQDQPQAAEEVVKPKRTRRPKAEAAPAAEPVAAEAPAAAKRAPRRRKVDADAAEPAVSEAPAAEVAVVEAAEPAPADAAEAKPRRAPRRKPTAAASESAGDVAPAADAAEPVREVTAHGVIELGPEIDAQPQQAAGAAPAEGASDEAPRGEGRGRDGRGRRDRERRREGDRGDRAERTDRPAQAAAEGEEDADNRPSRRAAIAAEQASEVFAELLSGDFDKVREEEVEDAAGEEGGAYKRVLRPEPDAPKLQKVLAQAGVGSRRDIEQMIEDGRIEVNDQVAHIGQRVSYGDRIKVAGRPIKVRIAPQPARILAYHKPVGEVVTHDDPQGRPTVFRRLPRLQNGKWMSVGRLDLNTEGLLLFTNSGELANQLMHPRFGVEREYAVRVLGSLDDASRQRLLDGVEIEGQTASFVAISNGLGEGVNQWYRVVITEGRNREVRKLFDAVGLTVNRLIRVRYGAIVLPRGLKRGVWVELGESDVRAVKSLAGMDRVESQQPRGGKSQGQGGQQQKSQQGFKTKQGGRPQQGRPEQGPRSQGGQNAAQQQRPPRQEREPAPRRDVDDDFDHIGPIPNPLEQTFDRRFVKSGSKRITSGFGRPDLDHDRQQAGKQKGPRQPDPMQTSVGYIGADAFFGNKSGGGGRRGGGGGGHGGGGGGRGRR